MSPESMAAAHALDAAPAARRSARRPQPAAVIDDTVWRRARHAAVRALHAVDDAIHELRRDRLQILFEAASPLSIAVFRPVYERLCADPRLDIWFTTSDAAWRADQIFGPARVRRRVLSIERVRWMKFDAYVNTDFWNMVWLPRRARLVHFFHGVAGKYGLDAPTHIAPIVASFDRLMFANRDRLRHYAAAGLVDPEGPEAALVGYPKVDCLVDGSLDGADVRRNLQIADGRPTVLYAPTWSPYSSLNAVGLAVVETLASLDVNVIVKLHDRSLDGSERGSGGIDWRRELARFADRGVRLAQTPDAAPYLAAADLLVTDHSSVAFEYMLLDRPIVSIDSPALLEKARIARDKIERLRSAAFRIEAVDQLPSAVDRALGEPERHSDSRRVIASDLFYRPGGATGRAVDAFYDLLDLPAPRKE